MTEVGADTEPARRFLDLVKTQGLDAALYSDLVPLPARYFCETTFCFIRQDKPHAVAAAFALGRERIIPAMFRRILARVELGTDRAPGFHYYLDRHIHLDGDFTARCRWNSSRPCAEATPPGSTRHQTAAEEALCARIRLWDGVLAAIETARVPGAT